MVDLYSYNGDLVGFYSSDGDVMMRASEALMITAMASVALSHDNGFCSYDCHGGRLRSLKYFFHIFSDKMAATCGQPAGQLITITNNIT